MATWSTIVRDLARTALAAAGRAVQSSPRAGSSDIDIPDLATVDDVRAVRRRAGEQSAGGEPDPDARARERAGQPDERPFRPDTPTGATPADPASTGDDLDRDRRRVRHDDDGVLSPGQVGPAATIEVQPAELDLVRTSYNPETDGDPDPGEVVWTWVPYEEADGRGKDRPVLVVARLGSDAVLAVQLSSGDHDGHQGWLALGAGDWDGDHRHSWVDLGRILLVHPDGMRREAATLDEDRFERVAHALHGRYRWPS